MAPAKLVGVVFAIAAVSSVANANEHRFNLTPFSDSTDDWRTRTFFTGQPYTVYGQISPMVLRYDDGGQTKSYAPVGNSNKTSRLGLRYSIRNIGAWSPVFRFEFGLSARPSSKVNLLDPGESGWGASSEDLRKFEIAVTHPQFGKFTFGQGSMATDNITEVDYSGTSVAAYSNVAAIAASQFLRRDNGSLSTLQVGDFIDNFDGANITGNFDDGTRKFRVRYDSPRFHGLTASVALGNEMLRDDGETNADAALRYEGDVGDFSVAAAIGYSWETRTRVLSGSTSVRHDPSGLNLTAAFGTERDGGGFNYMKLGLRRSLWAVGQTAFSLDWYQGRDIASDGSRATSVGVALVQSFDKVGIQAYALLRQYAFSERSQSYQDSMAIMSGIRWAF